MAADAIVNVLALLGAVFALWIMTHAMCRTNGKQDSPLLSVLLAGAIAAGVVLFFAIFAGEQIRSVLLVNEWAFAVAGFVGVSLGMLSAARTNRRAAA